MQQVRHDTTPADGRRWPPAPAPTTGAPAWAPEEPLPAPLVSTNWGPRAGWRRQQHTLDSIELEHGQSRSPLVAANSPPSQPGYPFEELPLIMAAKLQSQSQSQRQYPNPNSNSNQASSNSGHSPATNLVLSQHRSQSRRRHSRPEKADSPTTSLTSCPGSRQVEVAHFGGSGDRQRRPQRRSRPRRLEQETSADPPTSESECNSVCHSSELSLPVTAEVSQIVALGHPGDASEAAATITASLSQLPGEKSFSNRKLETYDQEEIGHEVNYDDDHQDGEPELPDEFDDQKRTADIELERAHGFEIVWLEFTYSVGPNLLEDPRWGRLNSMFHKEHKTIIKGISGGVRSGQMVALMGPSGAGKTCLLECISGIRVAGIGGRICLRGRKSARLVIVPQYDDFLPQFSVQETITYGSRMKNLPGTDHAKVADSVIKRLGLEVCRHNNIQRCSGGQRKRVAIAQEIVSRPNILILDEPTSGLDSSCCYQTMRVLRDVLNESLLTDQPMCIVTTIHQPSAKVFKMFDSVYLLSKTGKTAYSGPPEQLLPTIRRVTGLECPQYSNPSDYMIELVSHDYGDQPVERLIKHECNKARQFVQEYEMRAEAREGADSDHQTSSSCFRPKQAIEQVAMRALSASQTLGKSKSDSQISIAGPGGGSPTAALMDERHVFEHIAYKNNISLPLRRTISNSHATRPFFWHTWCHMHRSFLQSIRDPILNNMRVLIHICFATLLVLLYGKKSGEARGCPPVLGLPTQITDPNNDSMIDLADNVGYLFMCIMMITYVSLMSMVLTFPIDIKTVGKEYKNGWYDTHTYFLGKTIAELPFIICYPVMYSLITWYLTNQAQDHSWRYFSFTGLIIMNAMNSQSFGLILGAVFVNSVTAATFLGPVITIPWYLFTGFTKRIHRLAEPFKSTSRFLFTRFIFEGLLDTVYGHERCNCTDFLQQYHNLRHEEALRLGQMISVETLSSLDYYDGLEPEPSDGSHWLERTVDAASNVLAEDGADLNLGALMESNVKANTLFSFGLDFEPTCPANYRNYVIEDFRLHDNTARQAFISVACMLLIIRILTYLVVAWKIRTRHL